MGGGAGGGAGGFGLCGGLPRIVTVGKPRLIIAVPEKKVIIAIPTFFLIHIERSSRFLTKSP